MNLYACFHFCRASLKNLHERGYNVCKAALVRALLLSITFIFSHNAYAFVAASITEDDTAIDLTQLVEIFPAQGSAFQVSTAPGTDGIVRRIEVRAIDENHSGDWAVFVLANRTDAQIDRLIVAPHYRLVNAGVIWPDLGSKRINSITPSEGFALDREPSDEADIFRVTLNPGTTVTMVAELASGKIPQLYLWEPSAYIETLDAFTLYEGILIGIAALLALVLTNLFVVRWMVMLPATAMLAWVVLIYISIDFGFLSNIAFIGANEIIFWRAGSEILLAGGIIIFLFTYLSLHLWHINLSYMAFIWLIGLAVLFSIIIVDAEVAAGVARLSLAATIILSVGLIVILGVRGSDRAIMLAPTWILLLCWLAAAIMTVTGRVDNDILQPALNGGLVLVILLISFTVMQYVFSSGSYQQGLFSDAERQSLALTGSGDMVWDWDVARDRITTSPDISKSLGLTPQSLHGQMKNWLPILHHNDRDSFSTALDTMLEDGRGRLSHEFRLRAGDDHHHWFSLRARPVVGGNGNVIRCVGTIQDISDHKSTQERLLVNAIHDNLTGLPNEELFFDRLQAILSLATKHPPILPTVAIIELDEFKDLGNEIGLATGDTIILALARRMNRVLKQEDFIARLGLQQFGVIICSEQDPDKIATLVEALYETIKAPLDFVQDALEIKASFGVCSVVNGNRTAEDVIIDARLALEYARKMGGDRITPFRPAFKTTGGTLLRSFENVKQALEQDHIKPFYQPIHELSSNQLAGFEALMRWEDPKRGFVPPSEFVPTAEQNGQIFDLGMRILDKAAADMAHWQSEFGDLPLFLSVNLSATQLMKSNLFDDIQIVFDKHNVSPKQFKFELTETVLVSNPDIVLSTFEKLKSLGIQIAIDDYGTGYSSLNYLAQFPFDVIKIDRCITAGIGEKNEIIRRSILTLAKDLGMQVVAEGVTDSAQADMLSKLGCKFGQSFYYGAPKNMSDTTRLIRESLI